MADGQAPMGVGTTRSLERVAAALGLLEKAAPCFEPADDIPNGGMLCALPALLAIGLPRHAAGHFTLPKGFYPRKKMRNAGMQEKARQHKGLMEPVQSLSG